MKNIVFLSCKSLDGHVSDDQLLIDELHRSGNFSIKSVPWDINHDWSQYDLAIIRTTWDYHHRPWEFLDGLKLIEKQTKLVNSVKTVEWNITKKYLRSLEENGIAIVPTVFFNHTETPSIPFGWDNKKFVVKPCISANSYKTQVITHEELIQGKYKNELSEGDWMLQPFLDEIKDGEYSLHYFNRKFSHAIIKVPKSGDFRVQEEHGGKITSYSPTPELLKSCEKILSLVPGELLYARVDLVPFQGNLVLMELELIEPSLYFRKDQKAAGNFRQALERYISNLK